MGGSSSRGWELVRACESLWQLAACGSTATACGCLWQWQRLQGRTATLHTPSSTANPRSSALQPARPVAHPAARGPGRRRASPCAAAAGSRRWWGGWRCPRCSSDSSSSSSSSSSSGRSSGSSSGGLWFDRVGSGGGRSAVAQAKCGGQKATDGHSFVCRWQERTWLGAAQQQGGAEAAGSGRRRWRRAAPEVLAVAVQAVQGRQLLLPLPQGAHPKLLPPPRELGVQELDLLHDSALLPLPFGLDRHRRVSAAPQREWQAARS